MKNTTHRVVILKNMNSGLISQAILILKDTASENNSALMTEAEKIVEKYMNESAISKPCQSGRKASKIAALCAAFLAACVAVIMYLL